MVDSDLSVINPTLPFESEVKVAESMSSLPNPTLLFESVKTEVVALTKSLSCSSLTIENELKHAKVFMIRSDCSRQEEILSFLTKPSPIVRLFPLTRVT